VAGKESTCLPTGVLPIVGLPLPMVGASGSPIRAIAIVED